MGVKGAGWKRVRVEGKRPRFLLLETDDEHRTRSSKVIDSIMYSESGFKLYFIQLKIILFGHCLDILLQLYGICAKISFHLYCSVIIPGISISPLNGIQHTIFKSRYNVQHRLLYI